MLYRTYFMNHDNKFIPLHHHNRFKQLLWYPPLWRPPGDRPSLPSTPQPPSSSPWTPSAHRLHIGQSMSHLGQRYPLATTTINGRRLNLPWPPPLVGQPPARPHPDPTQQSPPLHRHFGKPTNWPNNSAGTAGRNLKVAHPLPSATLTQTRAGAGSLTKCHTKQRLSGYTPASRGHTAVY